VSGIPDPAGVQERALRSNNGQNKSDFQSMLYDNAPSLG